MALALDSNEDQPQEEGSNGALSEQENQDLHIAWMLAEHLLEKGGIDEVLSAASSSSNPDQAVGQFIAQLISQIHDSLTGELALSPNIYFSSNGLVDIIGDYLEDQGVDGQVVDNAEQVAFQIMSDQAAQNQPSQGGM